MSRDDVRDLLVDHALGVLDPEDAARVDAALAGSPALRAEVEALRSALYAVPVALEPEPLAPGAWRGVLTRIHGVAGGAEEDTTATADTATYGAKTGGADRRPAAAGRATFARPARPGGRRVRLTLSLALAAAVVLLAGSLAWGVQQQRRASSQAREQAIVAYWMRVPGMQVVPLQAAGQAPPGVRPGVVCVLPDGRAMVLQPHAAPEGNAYVVYGDTGSGRVELGRSRGTLIEFHADGLKAVEVAIPGPRGGVVAGASLR